MVKGELFGSFSFSFESRERGEDGGLMMTRLGQIWDGGYVGAPKIREIEEAMENRIEEDVEME